MFATRFGSFVAAVVLLLGTSATLAATLSHLYELNGSFSDTLGGPAITPHGGVLGATGYSFAPQITGPEGLSLSGALPSSVYTIDTMFSFTGTSGFGGLRKILDFHDQSSAIGLGNFNTSLFFFASAVDQSGPAGAFTDTEMARVTLTRDSAGLVGGYVDGVLQWSFFDEFNDAVFDQPDTVGHFFLGDAATLLRNSSAGFVDYIAVYDTALSATEVAALSPTNPIPEPETYAMLLAGLGLLGFARRRKPKQVAIA